jgi:hypothetical protein
MSIAQQVATPTPSERARRPSRPPQSARDPHPVGVLLRIAALVALLAVGLTLTLGALAVAFLLVISNLGG